MPNRYQAEEGPNMAWERLCPQSDDMKNPVGCHGPRCFAWRWTSADRGVCGMVPVQAVTVHPSMLTVADLTGGDH